MMPPLVIVDVPSPVAPEPVSTLQGHDASSLARNPSATNRRL
jgi:hypothetical protein